MAKKIERWRRTWLSNKLDTLGAKIAFFQDYLLVNNDKIRDQTETVLKEEKEWEQAALAKLAFRLKVEDPILSEIKAKEVKVINEKFYWHFRALKQTAKRRTARSKSSSETIAKWADEKHHSLAASQKAALDKIERKYTTTNALEAQREYQKA
ncbi:MAG TPA: hypothetical protein DD618_03535, partial [Acholeplasmatales bacterium]|nr:hypothetical protein [Acholeplasmatales bacterium]